MRVFGYVPAWVSKSKTMKWRLINCGDIRWIVFCLTAWERLCDDVWEGASSYSGSRSENAISNTSRSFLWSSGYTCTYTQQSWARTNMHTQTLTQIQTLCIHTHHVSAKHEPVQNTDRRALVHHEIGDVPEGFQISFGDLLGNPYHASVGVVNWYHITRSYPPRTYTFFALSVHPPTVLHCPVYKRKDMLGSVA